MAKRKTNVQFVKHVMEYSNHGALMQAFVMQALEQYAKSVAAKEPDQLSTGLVSGHAWHGCATELLREINGHYGRPEPKTLAELEKENPQDFRNP